MALDFVRANGDYISYGDNAAWDGFGNQISISLWIKCDNWSNVAGFINKRSAYNSQNSYSFGIGYVTAGRLYLELGRASDGGNTAATYSVSTVGWSTTEWIHLLVTYNGSNAAGSRCVIYKDGVAQSVTAGNDADVSVYAASSSMLLGRVNSSGSNYLDGAMAEVAVWSKELSSTDATNLSSNKYAPSLVEAASLVFYENCIDITCTDAIQSASGTLYGTGGGPDQVTHPSDIVYSLGSGSIILPRRFNGGFASALNGGLN